MSIIGTLKDLLIQHEDSNNLSMRVQQSGSIELIEKWNDFEIAANDRKLFRNTASFPLEFKAIMFTFSTTLSFVDNYDEDYEIHIAMGPDSSATADQEQVRVVMKDEDFKYNSPGEYGGIGGRFMRMSTHIKPWGRNWDLRFVNNTNDTIEISHFALYGVRN